jgi:hypothetical protein
MGNDNRAAALLLISDDEYRSGLEAQWLDVLDVPTPQEAQMDGWRPEDWSGLRARLRPAVVELSTKLSKLSQEWHAAFKAQDAGRLKRAGKDIVLAVVIEMAGIKQEELPLVAEHVSSRYPRLVLRLAELSQELATSKLSQAETELGNSSDWQGGLMG